MADRRKETVMAIFGEILAGDWGPHRVSHWAKQVKLDPQTIGEYAREAKHLIALIAEGDLPGLRAELYTTVAAIRQDARNDGDHGAALNACAQIAKLYGLNAAEKRELEIKHPASPEEALERVKRILAENPELASLLH